MPEVDQEGLPLPVADDERLARAVFSPFHVEPSGKIKKDAFKAPTGRKDVSVNRLRALSANECKRHARSVRSPGEFQGFAVIAAGDVRACGSDVVDSRQKYFGHADILHPVTLEKGVPAAAEFNSQLKRMAQCATYSFDPDPESDRWLGDDFASDATTTT